MNETTKKLRGKKTLMYSSLLIMAGLGAAITSYLSTLDWTQLVDPQYAPVVLMGIGVTNIVFRFVTKGPVGSY